MIKSTLPEYYQSTERYVLFFLFVLWRSFMRLLTQMKVSLWHAEAQNRRHIQMSNISYWEEGVSFLEDYFSICNVEIDIFFKFRQLKEYTRGIPDYNFQVGDIRFIRAKKKKEVEKENEEEFKAFEGTGQSLRQAKKKWFEDLDNANYVRWSNEQNL